MNVVVTLIKPKETFIQLRIREDLKDDFNIAAELRGASMSGLLHQFIARTVREEKETSPQAFKSERSVNGIRSKLLPLGQKRIIGAVAWYFLNS